MHKNLQARVGNNALLSAIRISSLHCLYHVMSAQWDVTLIQSICYWYGSHEVAPTICSSWLVLIIWKVWN